MTIFFDNNDIGEWLADKIKSGELAMEMRGVNNGEDFRLICFDIIPVEKSIRR